MNDNLSSSLIIENELLRTFVAVVEKRSFTKAAAQLGLSQPAVSGHIKRLQDQLGVDLFDKSAPGVRLTNHGQTALKYAREILATQSAMLREISDEQQGNSTLHVGVPLETRCWTLVPTLAHFQKNHPEIAIALHRGTTAQLRNDFERGQLDLYIGVTKGEAHGNAWAVGEALAWIASRDGAGDAPINGNGSAPLPVILHPDGCICTELMTTALADAGIHYRNVFIAPHIEGTIAAVRADMGVSVLPQVDAAASDHLRIVEDLPALPDIWWNAFVKPNGRRDLVEGLAQTLRPMITEHENRGGNLAN